MERYRVETDHKGRFVVTDSESEYCSLPYRAWLSARRQAESLNEKPHDCRRAPSGHARKDNGQKRLF